MPMNGKQIDTSDDQKEWLEQIEQMQAQNLIDAQRSGNVYHRERIFYPDDIVQSAMPYPEISEAETGDL